MNRILKADAIFSGSEMLTGNTVLELTSEGEIVALRDGDAVGTKPEIYRGILCPGFVNVHCHLELSHLKGKIEPGTGLPGFLYQVQQIRDSDASEKWMALRLAAKEMWDSGIMAVGDICNTTDTAELKKKHPLQFHNFIEIFGLRSQDAERKIKEATEKAAILYSANSAHGISLTPHAPYSLSMALFEALNVFTAGKIISMHNQETAAEDELSEKGTGAFLDFYNRMGIDTEHITATNKRSLPNWLSAFNKQQRVISVHNTETRLSDIEFVKNYSDHIDAFHICLCPNANLYIENKLPDIPMLLQSGFPLVLGTDSYASNHQLSIWAEIQTIRKHYPEIGLHTILQWATLNGARALGLENSLGSFEKGKMPGVIVIENDEIRRI